MKRERLTTNEIEINKNASYPLVDNMLRNRQQAVEQINKMFELDITVGYSSIWGTDNTNDSKVSEDESISDDTINSVDIDNNKPVASGTTQQEENSEATKEDNPEEEKQEANITDDPEAEAEDPEAEAEEPEAEAEEDDKKEDDKK